MRLWKIVAYLGFILMSTVTSASPARRGIMQLAQPDGSTFQAIIQGDEFARIKTTIEGHAITQAEDGWWCYATYCNDGSIYNSGYKVGKDTPAMTLAQASDIPREAIARNAAMRRMTSAGIAHFSSTPPTAFTERRGIVILAQFKDIKFKHSKEDFQSLLMSTGYSRNGAIGSAREYFDSQFGGSINFSFDVSDIITLGAKREYYGGNDSKGNDNRPEVMIADACRIAAENGIDFSAYDSDNDGKVDNIFVFFAGEDEAEGADESSIWSHAWYLFSGAGISLELNGKMIDRYACSAEMTRIYDSASGKLLETRLSGIGTFCHEYSHTFGLPDLYDTNYDNKGDWAAGLWGATSLMDSGNQNNQGNNPPHFNAIEREILGISSPIIIEADGKYTISPIEEHGEIFRINSNRENEYYLLECRSNKVDSWDEYIGGSGMLVYHIDKTSTYLDSWYLLNTVNANADHQCADLIEADGRSDIHPDYRDYLTRRENLEGIFFPYNKATDIPSQGKPGLNQWGGIIHNISITGIQRIEGGKISFNVIGFAEDSTPPKVKGNITYEPFCDGAIIYFESDRAYSGDAIISFGKTDGETTDISVSPYREGKYAILLDKLDPVTTYTASIHFEMNGIKGSISSVSFMTKKQPVISWPYISFGSAKRNSNGTFITGTRIPLKVNNSKLIEEISWKFDGTPITHEGDYYFTLDRSGILSAHIYMEDGEEIVLVKEITTSAMTIQ